MKEANASMSLDAMVECPHCEEYFDLFRVQHLLDDGWIYSELVGDDHWGKENWNKLIDCPECNKEIMIKNVEW